MLHRKLTFADHVFSKGPVCVCCADKRAFKADPTGTGSLRDRLAATMAIGFRQVRVAIQQAIVGGDLLQVKAQLPVIGNEKPLESFLQGRSAGAPAGEAKVLMFQRYFDGLLETHVMQGRGDFVWPVLANAYGKGTSDAQKRVGDAVSAVASLRRESLVRLAKAELQGINAAVSQKAVRAVSLGLMHNRKPMKIVRDVFKAIDKVGIVRSDIMADFMVVKAYNDGLLDTFEAAGVEKVQLVPEAKPSVVKVVGDARRSGPGSRISRAETPSKSTINRIKRAQRELEKLNLVNVLTAGDNKVCQVCEDISEDGPYTINEARSLIPAHARCRCAFVPATIDAKHTDPADLLNEIERKAR